MVTCLKFKAPQTYHLYRKKALQDWQEIVWRMGFLLLAIELCRLIEDTKHKGFNIWSMLWKVKILNFGYYSLVTFGRLGIVKLLKKCQQQFLNVTDFLMIGALILILSQASKIIDPGSFDQNPIWVGKEFLRLYAGTFCLCFTFFNWYVPFLYIGAFFGYICHAYVTLIPGYEWIYMPSYITVYFCLAILCYFLEKMRRTNFETNLEANLKEKVYKEILNEFPEGTLIINRKKEILYVNPSFYSILNINPQADFQGLDDISDIQDISIEGYSTDSSTFGNSGHPVTKFRDLQEQIWNQWPTFVKYFTSSHPHDEYKMFKGTYPIDETRSKTIEIKFTLRNFGGQDVALFIFSDVSERLLVAYLRETIEYKNRLLASVSHELRTPLNGNINFIQAAISEPSVPEVIKGTRLIPALRSARYLLILINDILDFSQIQAQSLRLVPIMKNIVDTAREAMELVEIQAQRKGLKLSLDLVQPDWEHDVKTDHNRVLQIIANLLSNALKFTFSGGITISIKLESTRIVRIEIEDTGMGIKQEDQSKLFKSFGKLDLGGKNYINSQGVGLGLIISNSLACMLGPQNMILDPLGSLQETDSRGICFESEPGKGSKFWFRVFDQDESKSSSNSDGNVPAEGNRINDLPEFTTTNANLPLLPSIPVCKCPEYLIADDDAFNILTLESMLHSLGLKSECAYNGQQVLEALTKRVTDPCSDGCQSFKMVFLDCNMPIMDGYECMTKLKAFFALYPEHECTVIACTAAAHQAEKDKALACGMKDFVTKPLNKARIQELISMYCTKLNNSLERLDSLLP